MTLSYETAKKLKDAGFLQEGKGGYWKPARGEKYVPRDVKVLHDDLQVSSAVYGYPVKVHYVYEPTLSELIEACGGEFYQIIKINHKDWVADCRVRDGKTGKPDQGFGNTPEEAVASLWLALQDNM